MDKEFIGGSSYDESSLDFYEGADQVRKRPAVIFGTNDLNGCKHAVNEIIANAIDESVECNGGRIDIIVEDNDTISVQDWGRGIPMDWNPKKNKYNWEIVFCQMYGSGKMNASNYKNSIGLNGLGATSMQYASEFMHVESVRNNKRYTMEFKSGKPIGELKVEDVVDVHTGTLIRFKPDKEVFLDIDIPVEFYVSSMRETVMLVENMEMNLQYKQYQPIHLEYSGGTSGYIQEVIEDPMIPDTIKFTGKDTGADTVGQPEYTVEMSMAFSFSRKTTFHETYHNNSYMPEGGVAESAFKACMIKVIEDLSKENGKLNRSDKLYYKDVEDIMCSIVTTSCPGNMTMVKNQTKTAINNPFIEKAFIKFALYNLTKWFNENQNLANKIITEVLANKEARESADAIKKKVIRKLSKSIDNFKDKPDKFLECTSKDPNIRELFIVEGDSAKSACTDARNPYFQAIMPLRGKILNCIKEDIPRILDSEIITSLMQVLGCGFESSSKYFETLPKFSLKKLNFNKIIIATDADVDGNHIRCLVIGMIYRLCPSLLRAGKVFIAETPLYTMTTKNGETMYAYNEVEKSEVMSELESKGYREQDIHIDRSKGLGENDPDMLSLTTMHPDTRRLTPITMDDNDETTRAIFDVLLGNDLEARKLIIERFFEMDVDID